MPPPSFNIALIIPTGIGAHIGGYGGDAMTLLPALSSICDTVITNPNVANAACFQRLPQNVLYVEGYALDRFFEGQWTLEPVRQNKIGILWDSGISGEMQILHQNTIAAVKTVYGVDIVDIVATSQPMNLEIQTTPAGRSAGRICTPEILFEAADKLISQGATAIAVCCQMPSTGSDEAQSAYLNGTGIDPIGGIEAMISHLLVARYQLPVAHAPVFTWEEVHPVLDTLVDARAASEFIVPTFLPCVLTGLSQAPQYRLSPASAIAIESLSAVILPKDALGGLPVFEALRRKIPVLAIENNSTVMACPAAQLQLDAGVVSCHNYIEALGRLVAMKAGVSFPSHFYDPPDSNPHDKIDRE